jgi:hypothetical protein
MAKRIKRTFGGVAVALVLIAACVIEGKPLAAIGMIAVAGLCALISGRH